MNPITFQQVPIGARFDVVPPTSPLWGHPFFIKISETTLINENTRLKETPSVGLSCYLDEDPLRRVVRLVREQHERDIQNCLGQLV